MVTHSSTVTGREEAGSTVFTPLLSQFICTHCSRSFLATYFALWFELQHVHWVDSLAEHSTHTEETEIYAER